MSRPSSVAATGTTGRDRGGRAYTLPAFLMTSLWTSWKVSQLVSARGKKPVSCSTPKQQINCLIHSQK